MKLGEAPKGIVASGWAVSDVFEEVRWNDPTKMALYANFKWDAVVNYHNTLFPIEILRTGIYEGVNWTPHGSGMNIPDDVAEQLEKDWGKFLKQNGMLPPKVPPGKGDDGIKYIEGGVKQVELSVFERSAAGRSSCIEKHGVNCAVCGFNFGEKYGEIGSGFIHVHHLRPLSEIREGYILNPVEDMRPVCPNCHAMLHQKKPEPYSIEELIAIIEHPIKTPSQSTGTEPVIANATPVNPTYHSQISDYGLYKCSICRSYIFGHDKEKHILKMHKGKTVEWSKIRS